MNQNNYILLKKKKEASIKFAFLFIYLKFQPNPIKTICVSLEPEMKKRIGKKTFERWEISKF